MSIQMDFFAVDRRTVTAYSIRNPAAQADFSLGLTPDDLDNLVRAIADFSNETPRILMDHMTPLIVNEPPDFETVDWETFEPDPEIYLVSPTLASQLAGLPDSQIEALVDRWFSSMAEKTGDSCLSPTSDFYKAVEDLVHVCRTAENQGLDVIYAWSL
jgi:hypothetical protein